MRLLLALVLLALLPAAASAATVTSTTTCLPPVKGIDQGCMTNVAFTAAPGEANDLTIAPAPAGGFRLADAGAPVEAQAPCQSVDANTADCPGGSVTVQTGNGDDRVNGLATTVDLGPGDDRATGLDYVLGQEGDDVLIGGDRGDRLFGGPGDDVVRGEGGNDIIGGDEGADEIAGGDGDDQVGAEDVAASALPDRADGGAGTDVLNYRRDDRGVTVDLATAATGGAAAGDVISGFEQIEGGNGPDVLAGDDAPNRIDGGLGDNRISGRGGDDILEGAGETQAIDGGDGDDRVEAGAGDDRVDGGPGDDFLYKENGNGVVAGGEGDDILSIAFASGIRNLRLACGAGDDVVNPEGRTRVGLDCEALAVGDSFDGKLALPLRLRRRSVVTSVRERRGERGRIVLRHPVTRRELGRATFRARGLDVPVPVSVRLPAAVARRARAAGRLSLIVDAVDTVIPIDTTRARLVARP